MTPETSKSDAESSKTLLDAFERATLQWGYQRIGGWGPEVHRSQLAYEEAKAKLEARLLKLEAVTYQTVVVEKDHG